MTFFSVDVETSSTNPFKGTLLTVGICAVEKNEGNWGINSDEFYFRIKNEQIDWDLDTREWWEDQADDVVEEAYGNSGLRVVPVDVARAMRDWVRSIEPDYDQSFFVANPVAFDKPWIDRLFAETEVKSPFHYRSLCLRSMKYGLTSEIIFGSDRSEHKPKIPHHALSDAEAQAYDLIDMLRMKAQ